MIDSAGETEKAKQHSRSNWVYNAQVHAEDFRFLKNRERNRKSLSNETTYIGFDFSEQSEWNVKVSKYLSIEAQIDKTASSSTIAAKLAACRANAKEKLITAIVLARGGHIICSLASISEVVENEELNRGDRLNACAIVLENITTKSYTFDKQADATESYKEWIFALKMHSHCARAINTVLALYQNQGRLDKLSHNLKHLINLADRDWAPKAQKLEKIALKTANVRIKTQSKLHELHQKPIIRSIHHLACSGGTLISKCLASMPDVALISEINPMNRHGSNFEPTNPLLMLERNYRTLTTDERIINFKMQIDQSVEICQKDDVDLILRDHSHTDFCTGSEPSGICPIIDALTDNYELISVITVRHPLDSYLGLTTQGWEKQFYPNDLNEYSRRYLAFLEKYSSSEIIRYENFCEDPAAVMKEICGILKISYDKSFINTFGSHKLSGDSGRVDLLKIDARPRRPIPSELEPYIKDSEYYLELVKRLGY